ncbi:DUF6732 family protein [Pseudooceanicola algae]|uniref:Uncharacterized protein n=1 Tax=Pseudooceanicola algae TaxID=1537215 RepID=A0A418SKU3_9RHOB|nr:hypothetical protein PSAL_022760 [Pseudooceanicola algae]
MPDLRHSRYFPMLGLAVLPLPAAAHPGHLVDVAGHSHWLGAAAIAAAIAIAALKALKGRRKEEAPEQEAAESEASEDDLPEELAEELAGA